MKYRYVIQRLRKTSFNFDSFILPKIKGGRNTAKLSYAYIVRQDSVHCEYLSQKKPPNANHSTR